MRQIEKRLTIEIDEDLKQQFKAQVSLEGSTLRETIEMLISTYLRSAKGASTQH